MEKLTDLIGKTVVLTFRRKSVNQYKNYEVVSLFSGFLELRGIEASFNKKSEGTWYQNVQEIDCISDVKPTVELPAAVVPVVPTVKAEVPDKKWFKKPGPSKNRLLGFSGD